MIYTPMTKRAMILAYNAHHGQFDKAGIPYILHPVHLAEQMDDEIACTVALLHDTVEDTSITLADLATEFPPQVVEALALLTHDPAIDYFDYVRAIKQNPTAAKVKLADLAHNSDTTRCAGTAITAERMAAWKEKYTKAIQLLTDTEE